MTNGISWLDTTWMIGQLQQPTAYPHPTDKIQTIQTHVSCVFLTGEYVYKVKKPMDFGFLNYQSLEDRRRFCEEEVRLNRRLCPDIYLKVVPITLQQGALHIGEAGTPVEWAVQMRQLDNLALLSIRLQQGKVTLEQVEGLATRLAKFHTDAPTTDAIQQFGNPSILAETIAMTLSTMDSAAEGEINPNVRRELRGFLERFLQEYPSLFRQRMEENRIRDCHGDLRAQNICLDPRYDAGIQIFDCIEFNDSFRFIDTAADIAYLLMDIDLAGYTELSRTLLQTYLSQTNDASLPEILPFYLVYRAIVRGNIALLAEHETEIPTAERQSQQRIAFAAYDLARCYAARRKRPALLFTVGYSGSGKSSLVKEMGCRLPAVTLSSDRIRKEQEGVPVESPLSSEQYHINRRSEVYTTLRKNAVEHLKLGQNVLLDATFLEAKERDAVFQLAEQNQADVYLLECQCADSVIRERLQRRMSDPNGSDADLKVYEQQLLLYATAPPLTIPQQDNFHHVVVDTGGRLQDVVQATIEQFLNPKSLLE